MSICKLRLLLVLLPLISAISLTACNAMAGKAAEQGKPSAKREKSTIEDRIDKTVMRMIDVEGRSKSKTPGIVVAYVWPHGSSVKGYGTTKIGTNNPPDGDTKFAVASVTKAITGLMLAQAVQSGKVSLEDKVQQSMKSPLKDVFDPDITYLQLVTHTSGLVNFPTNLEDYRDNDGDGKTDWTRGNPANLYGEEELVACLRKKNVERITPAAKGAIPIWVVAFWE